MLLTSRAPGCPLTPRRPNSSSNCRSPVCAAGNSPWGSPPGKSGSSGQGKKSKPAGDSKKGKAAPKSGRDIPKKPKSSSSGQGFGPQAQVKPAAPTYKITPPVTPQLLDELSPWESAAAPLWGTFCGHCEGTWLGQYSAYTPWGGDPEPVWADESGAYLTHAFSRVSEDRQSIPADTADSTDSEDTSSSSSSSPSASQDEMLDVLVRSTQRSASISTLIGGVSATAAAAAAVDTASTSASASSPPAAAAAAAAAAESSDATEDEDLEAIAYNINGSVVFNGGSYSLGPEVIEVPESDQDTIAEYYAALEAAAAADGADMAGSAGDDEDEQVDPLSILPFSTVVIEQALVAVGDKRLRLVATLKLRRPPGQELDIEIARLLLYKEYWYGTADSTSSGSKRLQLLPSHIFEVPVTQLSRPQPSDLAGTWNVFVLAANPAVEENPNTLQMETVVLYSSREERQHWHIPTITSSAAPAAASTSGRNASSNGSDAAGSGSDQQLAQGSSADGTDDDDSGGSFWLPGGAVVTLRMVNNPAHGAEADSDSSGSSSDGGRGHRGLLIGLHMLDAGGSALLIEREYDPAGQLFEVRQGTAVKGGWSGGRM